MKTVGSRELKNRLGRYLKLARTGETIVITDRGKAVAHLAPANEKQEEPAELEEILKQLEAEGHLRRGSGRFRRVKPIRIKGKPLSKLIIEDRK